jgi:hypothetical protein
VRDSDDETDAYLNLGSDHICFEGGRMIFNTPRCLELPCRWGDANYGFDVVEAWVLDTCRPVVQFINAQRQQAAFRMSIEDFLKDFSP